MGYSFSSVRSRLSHFTILFILLSLMLQFCRPCTQVPQANYSLLLSLSLSFYMSGEYHIFTDSFFIIGPKNSNCLFLIVYPVVHCLRFIKHHFPDILCTRNSQHPLCCPKYPVNLCDAVRQSLADMGDVTQHFKQNCPVS